jgi:undecaprenyl phosphate-alpha-L-ara4N flippase subunit ArnE
MWKIAALTTVQCLFYSGGQVFLKLALTNMEKFSFSRKFFGSLLTNWWLLGSGLCMAVGTILWFYILKHFELSLVYPLTSICYVFAMLAAVLIFHESVTPARWAGVALIMAGVILMVR